MAVTGATGFVGRHIVRALLGAGFRVRACARRPAPGRILGFEAPGLEWMGIGDVGDREAQVRVCEGVSVVVHAAALAHRRFGSTAARAELRRVNVDATVGLASASARAGVQRFVFISSVGAVCSSSEAVVSEATAERPDTDYGKSKLEAEQGMRRALAEGPTEYTILRPPLMYGSGNPANMARLAALSRVGLPLPFKGVRNRRSFLGVENLADLVVRCVGHPAAANALFIPCDGEDLSTPELLVLVGKAQGCRTRLFEVPAAGLGWCARWLPPLRTLLASLSIDGRKARTELGWVPPFPLSEGLARGFRGAF